MNITMPVRARQEWKPKAFFFGAALVRRAKMQQTELLIAETR
jgi:hypothetical protein